MIVSYSYERKRGQPRPAETYRGARRNAARGGMWRGAVPTGAITYPPVRANKSRRYTPFWRRVQVELKSDDPKTKVFKMVWRMRSWFGWTGEFSP